MLLSFALILICGLMLGGLIQKFKLPSLLGMMITGIILGPHLLNLISPSILDISAEIRQIALVVILTRAGLALDINGLKKVGRPAILMCFIPATIELTAVTIFAPIFLGVSTLEAAIMGSVLAAVSPAIVVPRMLRLMESGYGKKGIPGLIMAGASVDDIYVIVLFTSFLGMYNHQSFDFVHLAKVPFSIVFGLVLGALVGLILVWIFKKLHVRDTVKIIIIFSVAFMLVTLESVSCVPLSGLLAIMALGAVILKQYEILAKRLSKKLSKVWVWAELLLFVLVGAAVDIRYIGDAGFFAVIIIMVALAMRMLGVFVCLIKTGLNAKEKLFCAISYLPKATVQAAIGGVPLSMGVGAGNTILAVAVLAIMLTAPIGAIGMDLTYKKFLSTEAFTDTEKL